MRKLSVILENSRGMRKHILNIDNKVYVRTLDEILLDKLGKNIHLDPDLRKYSLTYGDLKKRRFSDVVMHFIDMFRFVQMYNPDNMTEYRDDNGRYYCDTDGFAVISDNTEYVICNGVIEFKMNFGSVAAPEYNIVNIRVSEHGPLVVSDERYPGYLELHLDNKILFIKNKYLDSLVDYYLENKIKP